MEKIELYLAVWIYLWVGFQLGRETNMSPVGLFWSAVVWPIGVALATISTIRDMFNRAN